MIPREEIISMAREAGFEVHTRKQQVRVGLDALIGIDSTEKLESFAALVEARVASADAERYQWLKDGMRGQAPLVRIQVCKRGYMLVSAEDLDAVIDESIRTRGAA